MIDDDDEVASPCVSVCKMSGMAGVPDALCAGCLRTIEEIAGWGRATANEKRAIWRTIGNRRAALKGGLRS